ncbi:hypothetical protein J3F83DRAFT_312592 [Trichoderma novae-zelandiae]
MARLGPFRRAHSEQWQSWYSYLYDRQSTRTVASRIGSSCQPCPPPSSAADWSTSTVNHMRTERRSTQTPDIAPGDRAASQRRARRGAVSRPAGQCLAATEPVQSHDRKRHMYLEPPSRPTPSAAVDVQGKGVALSDLEPKMAMEGRPPNQQRQRPDLGLLGVRACVSKEARSSQLEQGRRGLGWAGLGWAGDRPDNGLACSNTRPPYRIPATSAGWAGSWRRAAVCLVAAGLLPCCDGGCCCCQPQKGVGRVPLPLCWARVWTFSES